MKTTLRWLALLPGIVATILVANIITNIILKFWSGGDGDVLTFVQETSSGTVERSLSFLAFDYFGQPALIVGLAVAAGRFIAPFGKAVTGWIIASLFIAFAILGCLYSPALTGIAMWAFLAAVLVGAGCGATTPLEDN